MIKKLTILTAILFVSTSLLAQIGKTFPQMKGILLDDKPITVPINNGKYTVVAIAYHRNAEDALKRWLNPLYETFITKENGSTNFDIAEVYDVNFVFIPMISGFKKIAEDFKKGTDKEFWKYIMDTEKTDIKELQKQLGVEDNKIPYFYVLDKDGKIVQMEKGSFNNAKMEKLEEAIQ